jgi:hypothetical protein
MVEALRKAGEREMTDVSFDGHAEPLVCSDCACDPCDEDCRTVGPRAALEGWEKRPRLRDQQEVAGLLEALIADTMRHRHSSIASRDEFLDALEPLLFGERG